MISIEGAFDFHVHTAPSLFERPYNGFQIAAEAQRQRMSGFIIKHHFEPSVGRRAMMVQEAYPEVTVLGGVVLNRHVGGLNPFAVETAIKMGAAIVWFPTCDAQNHLNYFGNTSSYDDTNTGDGGPRLVGGAAGFERLTQGPGITVLDSDGELSQAAREVVDICARHDVIIGTAHLSRDETFAVDKYAISKGHTRLLLGHALWKPLGLEMDDLKTLRDLGVTIEFAASISCPIPNHASPRSVVEAIYELGPEHCILSSDAGAAVYPMAPEALRMYVQCLVDTGLEPDDAMKMMSENPLRLARVHVVIARIRTLHWGTGAMGSACLRLACRDPGIQVAGIIAARGRARAEEVARHELNGAGGALEVLCAGSLREFKDQGGQADVLLLATHPAGAELEVQIASAVKLGLHVVCVSEPAVFPWASNSAFAESVHAMARGQGVAVVGTGANPGFVMDLLPLLLSAPLTSWRKARVLRASNLEPFGESVLRSMGVGLAPEELEQQRKEGTIRGHVGFEESVALRRRA